MLDLEARWTQLWDELGSHSLPFSVIEGIYKAPNRTGFALTHLSHCFEELDAARESVHIFNSAALELSIWFQNLLLYPGAMDTTEETLDLIERWLRRHVPQRRLILPIRRMIVNARFLDIFAWTHVHCMGGWDTALLHDLNYSQLSKSFKEFREIMERYKKRLSLAGVDVPEIPVRTALYFCQNCQPIIFLTSYFREKYEKQARENIERYLAA